MKNKDEKYVVGYIRVSTVEQGISGLSLEAQEKEIRTHCKKKGLNEPKIFVDDSSGKDLDRPGIQEVFSLFKEDKLSDIVFTKVDRFSRNLSNAATCLDAFVNKGVNVHCLQIKEDVNSPMGRAFYGLLGIFAQLERDFVSERTKAALGRKKEKGEKVGRPPYGKKFVNKKLEVNMDEFSVVQKIMKMHDMGYSFTDITKHLNKNGIKNRSGKDWHRNMIIRIIEGQEVQRGKKVNV